MSTSETKEPVTIERLDKLVAEIYGEVKKLPGFVERPAQKRFIYSVARTLSGLGGDPSLLISEAPTGTGKSIGYLVGGLVASILLNKPLVVSTATVLLQEQLIGKDIPMLYKLLGDKYFTDEPLIVKGRGRYLCVHRMLSLVNGDSDQNSLFGPWEGFDDIMTGANWPRKPKSGEPKRISKAAAELINDAGSPKSTAPQTIDELHGVGADLAPAIGAARGTCLGSACNYRGACPLIRMRQRASGARLIIANHALVLASITHAGGHGVLPPPDEAIYVFDEGHKLGEIARKAFSGQVVPKTVAKFASTLSRALGASAGAYAQVGDGELVAPLQSKLQHFAEVVADMPNPDSYLDGKSFVRFDLGEVPEDVLSVATAARDNLKKIVPGIKKMHEDVKNEKATALQPLRMALSVALERLNDMNRSFYLLANPVAAKDPEGRDPTVLWCEEGRYEIARIEAGRALNALLWKPCVGAVITSATLRTTSGWHHIYHDLGLPREARALELASPFDYSRSMLIMPKAGPDPRSLDEHAPGVAGVIGSFSRRLAQRKGGHGILLLCASWRELDAILDELSRTHPALAVIRQGDEAISKLSGKLRERVDDGEVTLLAGVASLAEGLDLPGHYCEAVVISKLPFAVPDNPIEDARADACKARGGNPFRDLSLPETSRRLMQAAGRLIRNEKDCGAVILCDPRVMTKSYGKSLTRLLPPFRHITHRDAGEIASWIDALPPCKEACNGTRAA